MKINNSVLTGNVSQQIEARVKKVLFVCSAAHGGSTNPLDILTTLAGATLEIEKQTVQHGGYAICPEISFVDLLEMNAQEEGSIEIKTEGANFILRGVIDLAEAGAVELAQAEYFKLKLSGFTGVNVDLYALDTLETTRQHRVYKTHYVNANTPKNMEVAGSLWLAVPDATIKKLELIDGKGRIVSLEKEELRAFCNENNPLTVVSDGKLSSGYLNILSVPVGFFNMARITTTQNENVYTVNAVTL
jgi:hypothetical protein